MHHGSHYQRPVEILDLADTIYDLNDIRYLEDSCPTNPGKFCHTNDGLSLAPVIIVGSTIKLRRDFALSQTRVCREPSKIEVPLVNERGQQRPFGFYANGCSPKSKISRYNSFMGYSMRTENYRCRNFLSHEYYVLKCV
jgi:hypothetical protein